jgi:hypothetical protein
MASILNATTSSGLVTSADNSGSLQLATNNGTTAVTITTAQNVGIGTASPAAKLETIVSVGSHRLGTNGSDVNYNVRANAGSNASITFTEDGISDRWTVGCVNAQNYLAFRAGSSNMTNGTEQMRIDSSGNLGFNSGYGSVATAYGCRAWVNFNGTGTVAIRASGNVSSITDNGTGDYTANFTNSMPDTNYAFGGYCTNPASRALIFGDTNTFSTGSFRVSLGYTSGFNGDITKIDASIVNMEFFR